MTRQQRLRSLHLHRRRQRLHQDLDKGLDKHLHRVGLIPTPPPTVKRPQVAKLLLPRPHNRLRVIRTHLSSSLRQRRRIRSNEQLREQSARCINTTGGLLLDGAD
jgi:hypothetical protein